MKKIVLIIIYIFIIFTFISCTNTKKSSIKWKKIDKKKFFLDIEPGDIIIKEKKLSLLGIFGHSAIIKDERTVVDYPKFGKSSYQIDIDYWLEENRDILVLRYKNMNDFFRKKLIENIDKYSNKKYKIVFNKKNNDNFYCSQFIWYVYYKTAAELGFYLDLDSNKGLFIFPYDFINSQYLKIIN